jgi:hypothetical protein
VTGARTRPWNPRPDEAGWDFTAAHTDPRPEPGLFATLATTPVACGVLARLVVIALATFAFCLWRF